jgi:CxxC motif-containing protein
MSQKKKMICTACPQGCVLEIETDGKRVIKLSGHKCSRGESYARQEIEAPVRVLTSTVLTEGLELKMVPVKTSGPIPREQLMKAMQEVKRLRLDHPLRVNEPVVRDFLVPGIDLIVTREAE